MFINQNVVSGGKYVSKREKKALLESYSASIVPLSDAVEEIVNQNEYMSMPEELQRNFS
jgi:hypothetical protein